MRLSRLNDFSNSYNYFLSSLSSTDENTIKGVVKVSNHYVSYGEMLLSLDSFDNELVRGVCKKITTNSFGTQTMSIKNVAFKFDKIINNSEISSEELLSREWTIGVSTKRIFVSMMFLIYLWRYLKRQKKVNVC